MDSVFFDNVQTAFSYLLSLLCRHDTGLRVLQQPPTPDFLIILICIGDKKWLYHYIMKYVRHR